MDMTSDTGSVPGFEGTKYSFAAPTAPDGGYGWVIVTASFVFHAMVDGTFSVHGVFLPQFTDYFDVGRGQIAAIGSVMGGCLLLSGPFVSLLVNCCGCRKVAVTGGILTALGLLASAFVSNAVMLIVTMGCITGMGLGMMFLPAVVTVGCYFERRRALASGICSAGSGIGMCGLAPLLAFLLERYDWRNAIVIVSGIALHTIVFAALLRPLSVKVLRQSCVDVNELQTSKKSMSYPQQKIHQQLPDLSPKTTSNTVTEDECATNQQRNCEPGKYQEPPFTTNTTGSCTLIGSHRTSAKIYCKEFCSNIELRPGANKERLPEQSSVHRSHDAIFSSRPFSSPLSLRKDIFYSGSFSKIPKYRPHPEPHYASRESTHGATYTADTSASCSCIQPENCMAMKEMLGLSLLSNAAMLVIAIANAFWQLGYMIPIVFISDYGISRGIDARSSALFVAFNGVAMMFGRGIGGVVGNLPNVNPLYVTVTSLLVAGISCLITPFCETFLTISLCIITAGFMLGPIVPLTTVFLVDYLGINKLTNAVGLVSMAKGILCFFGAPIAGILLDVTGSYLGPFCFAGAVFILSGIIFLFLLAMNKQSL